MAYTPQKTIKELLEGILEAVQPIKILGAVRGVLADIRVTVLNAINVGTVTTVTGVTTVTTVNTLGNQTSVGGYVASNVVQSQTNITAVSSNINNLIIT